MVVMHMDNVRLVFSAYSVIATYAVVDINLVSDRMYTEKNNIGKITILDSKSRTDSNPPQNCHNLW